MATVVYAARALDHLERAFQLLRDNNPDAAHPLVGHRIEGERELGFLP